MSGRVLQVLVLASCLACAQGGPTTTLPSTTRVPLAPVAQRGDVSLHAVLWQRRSCRAFDGRDLSRDQIAQLVWAAQGVSDPASGFRTAPSAGALYPLDVYLVTGQGTFRYVPGSHALERTVAGDLRRGLRAAALGQAWVEEAGAVIVLTGVVSRTQRKYGTRARRYVHIEAGHAAQNVLLMATALGLGAVPIGAFDDAQVARLLELGADHEVLYLLPIGRPRTQP